MKARALDGGEREAELEHPPDRELPRARRAVVELDAELLKLRRRRADLGHQVRQRRLLLEDGADGGRCPRSVLLHLEPLEAFNVHF